ncbi:MAG TPA: F0F1 ATP synthase subunit epsilon [Myxococcales bacterium]|jgi:F-type H+-transporting ATPase subunit epsilon
MRLHVSTPLALVLDAPDVRSLRAEDDTGGFGVLPGHADFLTVLSVSVLTWVDAEGHPHHLAVRGGVLAVRGGREVEVATPEAVVGEDLEELERSVLVRFREQARAEEVSRLGAARLQLAAMRQILRYLRPDQHGRPGAARPGHEGASDG